MNIETLLENINLFEYEIIESGFQRDIQDYLTSMPTNQNNIVALREIAENISERLVIIYNGDLPDALSVLFPKPTPKPFTATDFSENLLVLIKDTKIDQTQFYAKLNDILTKLNQLLTKNIEEIKTIKNFIIPYIDGEQLKITDDNTAILSIVFKDKKTITNLKEFTKNIGAWNRTLPLFHQILSSASPKDIEIVEVQNGSIDFVVSFDVNIALDLVELFKVGFKCYAAYLSYKKIIAPITDAYFGNQKLLKSEKAREEELLNNISIAISSKIEEQHKLSIKSDKNIDKNIDKKVEQVTALITSHIIKGNDLKLLAFPESDGENNSKNIEIKKELQAKSSEVRAAIKELPEAEFKKLLKQYGEIKDETVE